MMRNKTLKLILFLIFMLIYPLNSFSTIKTDKSKWKNLITAIIQVESKGKANIVSKDCVGILQIRPIVVKDCNRILGKKKYTLKDRYDVIKSKEMFNIIQNYYNPTHNIEIAIRLWNGGCGWRKNIKKTQPYYKKVMKEFNKLK